MVHLENGMHMIYIYIGSVNLMSQKSRRNGIMVNDVQLVFNPTINFNMLQ